MDEMDIDPMVRQIIWQAQAAARVHGEISQLHADLLALAQMVANTESHVEVADLMYRAAQSNDLYHQPMAVPPGQEVLRDLADAANWLDRTKEEVNAHLERVITILTLRHDQEWRRFFQKEVHHQEIDEETLWRIQRHERELGWRLTEDEARKFIRESINE